MTPKQTLALTRYVKACCPQQAMDSYTPDAWYDLLGDLPLEDCRAAVVAVAKRQPFVAPAEIRAEVRAIRDERLRLAGDPAPPAELLDDPAAYRAWIRRTTKQIADGQEPQRAIGSAQ